MEEFFANLYEWFGLIPLYSRDMGDLLRGLDLLCEDYVDTPWYLYIGWIMILTTLALYALQYHVLDSPRFSRRGHWWIMALCIVTLNFLIAFAIPYNIYKSGNYCEQLVQLSMHDSIGFGFSNALWSFMLFVLITSLPLTRRWSRNTRMTTFWKP